MHFVSNWNGLIFQKGRFVAYSWIQGENHYNCRLEDNLNYVLEFTENKKETDKKTAEMLIESHVKPIFEKEDGGFTRHRSRLNAYIV